LQEFDHVFEQLQRHGSVDVIYLTTQDQELIARLVLHVVRIRSESF
jgi:UPF0042 nucleotide-binding protein